MSVKLLGRQRLLVVAASARSEEAEVGPPPAPVIEFEDVGSANGFVAKCNPDCSRSLIKPSMSIIVESEQWSDAALSGL